MKKAFGIGAICLAFTAVASTSPTVFAQDKKGPLADLPSKPGPHVEKIKALGDNEWLNLGAPAADPKWGKARGSSWGAKALILAPDKRGAFLFGEGVHAYVKPDGHIMDDLWFYDINAHAWICLYPGTDTKTFTQRVKDGELLIDDDGQLIDKDKQPVPVHTLVHAWGYLAYDSDRKKFAFLSWNGTAGGRSQVLPRRREADGRGAEAARRATEGQEEAGLLAVVLRRGVGPVRAVPGEQLDGHQRRGLPSIPLPPVQEAVLRRGFRHRGDFRPGEEPVDRCQAERPGPQGVRRLRLLRLQAEPRLPQRRRRLQGRRTHGLRHREQFLEPPETHGNRPAAGEHERCVLRVRRPPRPRRGDPLQGEDARHLRVRPEDELLGRPDPFPADGPKFHFAANTFFDRELNAYFCHVAGDSRDDGVMWVYRYKK